MMLKPLYNKKGWILGVCTISGHLNYVEPHGTTAKCKCSEEWTEHEPIPYEARIGMFNDYVDTKVARQIIELEKSK